MALITVECPTCHRRLGVNGHGPCPCGEYVVHHVRGVRPRLMFGEEPEAVWDVGMRPPIRVSAESPLRERLWVGWLPESERETKYDPEDLAVRFGLKPARLA